MKEFFEVVSLARALEHCASFPSVASEPVKLDEALGRVLARDIVAGADLPGFCRSTMDGYAVQAASTFGASESAPALCQIVGTVEMGAAAEVAVGPGQAARILTGGMIPPGADAVVMVEHTEELDESAIEVIRAVAPQQNVVAANEDMAAGERLLRQGDRLRPQDLGLLAALGRSEVEAYLRPTVAILSTGDEIVPVEAEPGPGQVRDVNSSSLSAMARAVGGLSTQLGIVGDDFVALRDACASAMASADMLILSGGSSVGTRDLTLEVLSALPDSGILAHGVAIKPGKPTILARVGGRAFWGLPGHVASAIVVFRLLVAPLLRQVCGERNGRSAATRSTRARVARDVASVHGRREYVRVRLEERENEVWAVPLMGKSGLLRTVVESDGLLEIDDGSEGLSQGMSARVYLW